MSIINALILYVLLLTPGGDCCPGSLFFIHARCKLSVTFSNDCDAVSSEIAARDQIISFSHITVNHTICTKRQDTHLSPNDMPALFSLPIKWSIQLVLAREQARINGSQLCSVDSWFDRHNLGFVRRHFIFVFCFFRLIILLLCQAANDINRCIHAHLSAHRTYQETTVTKNFISGTRVTG